MLRGPSPRKPHGVARRRLDGLVGGSGLLAGGSGLLAGGSGLLADGSGLLAAGSGLHRTSPFGGVAPLITPSFGSKCSFAVENVN